MRCPTCHTAYPPEIRFCPADGAPLVAPETALDTLAALADGPAPSAVLSPVPARTSPAVLTALGMLGLAVIALTAVLVLRPADPPVPAPPEPEELAPRDVGDFRMVRTPTDGYLSIRSEPDGRGTRLDRMLDGEVVEVLTCSSLRVAEGDRGHWCRVRRQSGQTGWAFDPYLVVYDDAPM